MADEQLHQADKLRHKENECKDHEAEERMAENFADDVTVQDAHGANGECNTPAGSGPERRAP
jgi:hypothetical protein